MKNAPVAIGIVFALGLTVGGYAASWLYAERLAANAERVLLADQKVRDIQEKSREVARVEGVPMIQSYGAGAPEQCHAAISGARLATFAERFSAVLICGITRPNTDRLTDTSITVSNPFSIEPVFVIGVPSSPSMKGVLARFPRPVNIPRGARLSMQLVTWYEIALVPKGLDLVAVHSLADIERVGGKRFPEEGRTLVAPIEMPNNSH